MMRASELHEGDVILVGEKQLTVTKKLIPTVWFDDGTVLPRTVDVTVVAFNEEETEL